MWGAKPYPNLKRAVDPIMGPHSSEGWFGYGTSLVGVRRDGANTEGLVSVAELGS